MKSYDAEQKSNYMMYLDRNNLYGYVMSQYLSYVKFKWSDEYDEYCVFDVDEWSNEILNMKNDSEHNYILEVDLKYFQELHDHHKDLPFAPEGRMKLVTTI